MGYQTSYTLKSKPELIQLFREECEYAGCALDKSGEPNDSYNWYDHEEDLKAFSKKHPKELFELSGEGEEPGDIWTLYVKNGKSQRCEAEIVVAPFDESKLK